jgi:hypothetical protein
MKIPIIQLRTMLQLMSSGEYPDIERVVKMNLENSQLEPGKIETILERLLSLEQLLMQQEIDVEEWPELSEEWCALLSWLLKDLAASSTSEEFSRELRRIILEEYEKNAIPLPDDTLWLTGWVCGRLSKELLPSYSVQYPLRAANLHEHEAALAYEGLRSHLRMIPTGNAMQIPETSLEMTMTAVPIRVSGLCEAISNVADEESSTAAQVLGILLQKSKATIPENTYKEWIRNVDHLINTRNSIAHIRNLNRTPNFKQVVQELDIDRVREIAKISGFLMAGWVREKLDDIDALRFSQWVAHADRELEQCITENGYF